MIDPALAAEIIAGNKWIVRLGTDRAYRRKFLFLVTWISIGVIMAASVVCSLLAFMRAKDLADAAALAGFVLVAATLLLTMIAAAVAVLAYATATGAPDLQIRSYFLPLPPNAPYIEAGRSKHGTLHATGSNQVVGNIGLRNIAPYSARNPAVAVRLEGMAFDAESISDGWAITEWASTVGVTGIQWDGGVNYAVHGKSTRQLPALRLGGLAKLPGGKPCFAITILADGYRRTLDIAVGFMEDACVVIPVRDGAEPGGWL